MRRILATDFGIWPAASLPGQTWWQPSNDIIASSDYWARLANYILLYDQIVIPTGDLQIVPVLRHMLGEGVFGELLRNKGIVLARYDQWIAYVGNGVGLSTYQLRDPADWPKDTPNIPALFFKPLDYAIKEMLSISNPPSTSQRLVEIENLLSDNIITLPTQVIAEGLKDEAYRDILGSPYLRDFLSLRNTGRSLNSLVGVNANQLIIHSPHVAPPQNSAPEIRAVLRVAFENFLLSIGGHIGATEITGDDSTLNILRAKGQRIGYTPKGHAAFTKIQKITGVPELGIAFARKQLSAAQLVDLRYSTHGQALRDWFADGAPSATADETVSRYVETVGKPSWLEAMPAKILRFACTTGVGVAEPISGAAASAIDMFLLSKWFPARSPRLFLTQAKTLLANTPVIANPVMHGRDRNTQCSCGSGKKFKKCCGR